MKNLFAALLVVSLLLSGCTPAKEQEPPPSPQQPTAETKVFQVSPEDISQILVATTLGPPSMTPVKPRPATPEEIANIVKWYNSITEYKEKTCCPEENGPDARIDMYLKRKVNDMTQIHIGLYRDQVAAWGKGGEYWVEQPELYQYLKTVQ